MLFFNYRNGNIGTHHITHGAADTILGMLHFSREVPFLADGVGFAQTFLRAGIDAQIASFALIGVHFNSWHNSPMGPGV